MQLDFLNNHADLPNHLSSGFPEKMVFLDCETTGGRADYHRIIEIGLLVVEDGRLVETWQSFINPETSLPPFIQRLTGIQPAMVAQAPLFAEIAPLLLDKLQGRTLVAHNARFDYSFLKQEFRRAGIDYSTKPLCSVRFSRNLYPQFKRHSLSTIIQRFQISIENRHRALDDARVIYDFFLKTTALLAADDIQACCRQLLKNTSLPPLLEPGAVDNLPKAPGVYYFYDQGGALLYIGKSINIRHRVLSHFSSDHSNPKDLRISRKLAHIDFELTPTDFGAQLRESDQIKQLSPIYNRRLRRSRKLFQYRVDSDNQGYQRLTVQQVTAAEPSQEYFGLFRSPRQALTKLQQLADQFSLCHRLLGLESTGNARGDQPCFRYQLKKCLGACCGREPPDSYNQRLDKAIKQYPIQAWPYPGPILVEERSPQDRDLTTFHLVDNWRYIAKLSLAEDIYDHGLRLAAPADVSAAPTPSRLPSDSSFDLDMYFILIRFLLNPDKLKLNNLKLWPLVSCQ